MLFNFELCPFNQIPPWGKPGELNLHWFGLSDGYYWIEAGGSELFRYSQALVELRARTFPSAIWSPDMPYVDYQVVRLWEDVIETLPKMLEPIPPWLARTLGPDGQWSKWQRQIGVVLAEGLTPDEAIALESDACQWWWWRSLDTLYLRAGPDIKMWSDGTDMHIEWDNRGLMLEGLPAWDAQLGEYRMPVEAFMEEVRAFDARFIRRMHDRIALARVDWTRPDVALDPGINAAHEHYAQWLTMRMMPGVRREQDDWDAVYEAIARIETLMPADSPQLL